MCFTSASGALAFPPPLRSERRWEDVIGATCETRMIEKSVFFWGGGNLRSFTLLELLSFAPSRRDF